MMMTKDQLRTTAILYLPREGGFAAQLAKAYLYADSDNQRRIEQVFMHLFERAYHLWGIEEEAH